MSKKTKDLYGRIQSRSNQGNVSETARQLGISMQTLLNWNNKAKAGTLAFTQQYSPDLVALLEENKKTQTTT